MRPGVEHLRRRCRVITFSLADEPTSGARFEPENGFNHYLSQVGDAMDAAGLQRAVICGVSYGGLIAFAFAARHPERVSGLVLVSALPPSWTPDARMRRYARTPLLHLPLFCVGALRMYPEVARARGGGWGAVATVLRRLATVATHPFSPTRVARRVMLWTRAGLDTDAVRIEAPTLVVTGEPELDRVVAVSMTREYLTRCPRSESAIIERTGHLGSVTRPDRFAEIVGAFVERCAGGEGRRLVG